MKERNSSWWLVKLHIVITVYDKKPEVPNRKCKLSQTHRKVSQLTIWTTSLHHSSHLCSITATQWLSPCYYHGLISSSQLDLHELHIVGIKMIFLSGAAVVQCLVRLEAHVRCSTVRNDRREVRKDRNWVSMRIFFVSDSALLFWGESPSPPPPKGWTWWLLGFRLSYDYLLLVPRPAGPTVRPEEGSRHQTWSAGGLRWRGPGRQAITSEFRLAAISSPISLSQTTGSKLCSNKYF